MSERLIRVLLVDDEELVRGSLLAWLEDDRFQISEAESGAEALELLATESFDCGILDLQLPDMSGVEVLKTARYAGKKPFWLVMTGNLDEETYQRLRELGVADDAILQKPIFDMQLISASIFRSITR